MKCEADEMAQVSPPQDCCSQVGKAFQEEEKMTMLTKLMQLHHPPGLMGDPPACERSTYRALGGDSDHRSQAKTASTQL